MPWPIANWRFMLLTMLTSNGSEIWKTCFVTPLNHCQSLHVDVHVRQHNIMLVTDANCWDQSSYKVQQDIIWCTLSNVTESGHVKCKRNTLACKIHDKSAYNIGTQQITLISLYLRTGHSPQQPEDSLMWYTTQMNTMNLHPCCAIHKTNLKPTYT